MKILHSIIIILCYSKLCAQIQASRFIRVHNIEDTLSLNQIINPYSGIITYVNSDNSLFVFDGIKWKNLMYPPIGNYTLSQDTLGGIVAYIYKDKNQQQRGFLISTIEGDMLDWQSIPRTTTNATSFWDGKNNTNLMSNSPIKDWLDNNFTSDWYIQSHHEMILIMENRLEINKALLENNHSPIDTRLWTSTEYNTDYVFVYQSGSNLFSLMIKNPNPFLNLRVRAIKRF